jgi:hypothetical protein
MISGTGCFGSTVHSSSLGFVGYLLQEVGLSLVRFSES